MRSVQLTAGKAPCILQVVLQELYFFISEEKMEKNRISNVTEQGLLIPKDWLTGIERVELFKRDNIITIKPVVQDDPIFHLGKNPVSCGITDGSENHDKYTSG